MGLLDDDTRMNHIMVHQGLRNNKGSDNVISTYKQAITAKKRVTQALSESLIKEIQLELSEKYKIEDIKPSQIRNYANEIDTLSNNDFTKFSNLFFGEDVSLAFLFLHDRNAYYKVKREQKNKQK